MKKRTNRRLNFSALALVAALFAPIAWAAGGHDGGHGDDSTIGKPGEASEASRTVEVKMHDNYYEPENISVEKGETVRFVASNEGVLVHEFNIGTAAMHEDHQEEMKMMMEHGALEADNIVEAKMEMGDGETMKHDDPNSVLLEPGDSAEVVWTFTGAGDLEFACNVPGHYASGMVGPIRVD